VSFEDRGDHLVVRPFPDDPIDAAYGSLKGLGIRTDELRAIAREDERRAEERRQRA
jgi:hypothetical protein